MVALVNRQSIQAEKARRSFALFVKDAWHVIEPGRPFVAGWHLDAIAEHLQAVSSGQIKKLLVNMPPRHGKSSLISVLWSDWLLLNNPSLRLLCASYALNLATRDNVKARRLIKSPWFQDRYGEVFRLTNDQDAKMKFETNQLGYRMSVSVGSAATGEGGDILILDDPHNIDEKESDVKRGAALDWFDNTWSTRLNDQQTGAMVVVGQRIHEQDVSGHILETNDGDEWVHLNLPAEYEEGSACKTYLSSGNEFWTDPRKVDGELLWREKFPQSVIEKAKKRHGPYAYAALYGQRPVPASGGTFKQKHERLFSITRDSYILHTPKGDRAVLKKDCFVFVAVDPAISEEESADYTVIGSWAVTPIKDLLLLQIRRDRWSHPDQQDEIEEEFYDAVAEFVASEKIAYQTALIQDLVNKGIPCRPFTPQHDKVTRASAASIWQQNGKMYFLEGADYLIEYRPELYKFPKSSKKDQVDMTSLASIVVRSRGPLSDDAAYEDDIPDPIEGPIVPEEDETIVKKADDFTVFEQIAILQSDPFAYAASMMGGNDGAY
jgi:predicted phage terminase large subunit-like protein